MILKLRAVGNSLGVIIPSYVLRSMGWGKGSAISVKIEGYEGVEPARVGEAMPDCELDAMVKDTRSRRAAEGKFHQDEK